MLHNLLVHIPKNAVITRYKEIAPGQFAVVTVSGQTLAPSYYHLRHSFEFYSTIYGSGSWVVLMPKPKPTQPALF